MEFDGDVEWTNWTWALFNRAFLTHNVHTSMSKNLLGKSFLHHWLSKMYFDMKRKS